MTRPILPALALLALSISGAAPAGVKPCRDRDGKVVTCKAPRQASPRCKDAAGRFVACPQQPAKPLATRNPDPR